MADFGKALKEARIAKNLTLREVGENIGKSIGYLADIEHGRKRPPDLETVRKIENFLRVTDGYLVNLAREVRNIISHEFSRKLRSDTKLSTILLRAEKLSEEKKDQLLKTIMELEEN